MVKPLTRFTTLFYILKNNSLLSTLGMRVKNGETKDSYESTEQKVRAMRRMSPVGCMVRANDVERSYRLPLDKCYRCNEKRITFELGKPISIRVLTQVNHEKHPRWFIGVPSMWYQKDSMTPCNDKSSKVSSNKGPSS